MEMIKSLPKLDVITIAVVVGMFLTIAVFAVAGRA